MGVNTEMSDTYIIILNYNNLEDTISCIDSVINTQDYNPIIVLVDNGSSTACVNSLQEYIEQEKKTDIVFIKNKDNVGYAAGNNIGIRYAIDHNAKYIVVLNNDVIVNKDSIQKCIAYLENHQNVAIVGPAILEVEGDIIQSTGANINYLKCSSDLIDNGKKYKISEKVVECDYVGGACMVFRPTIVNDIGLIPEVYFLFWEEAEWCVHAKKHGYGVVCLLNSFVRHKGSATIKKTTGMSAYYMERNKVIFLRRNAKFPIQVLGVSYLFFRSWVKGITRNKDYITFSKYYIDGIIGKDMMKESLK